MDPEMMRLAQEQVSRMRPEDLQRMQQQMLSNPDLLRMASEGMKNMRPEDLRMAAEQMKNIPPEQIADMSARMATASPGEIASMRARAEAQQSYEYQGALTLKAQGNQLHGVGKYSEAAEKYLRAKKNLIGIITPEAKNLHLTCSLNLMSCYLKTKQYDNVIAEGTEVLKGDPCNLKAFYRRGQAYKELKMLKLAVSDLKRAAEISPEDETIADILRQANQELEDGGEGELVTDGPIIEEITDEEAKSFQSRVLENTVESSSNCISNLDHGERSSTSVHEGIAFGNDRVMGENIGALTQNPDMVRSMHSMMSSMNPEHLAAMSGGGMTPDMAKMAADMVKNMSPDDLGKMMNMASQLQTQGPSQPRSTTSVIGREVADMAASGSASLSGARLDNSSSHPKLSSLFGQNSGEGMPSMANFSPEMQEQVRKQMKDPALKQMMASMMKSMTPETMASMSEQLGMKLSPEEAEQAQKAVANLSPDDFDKIMRWVDRAQKVTEQARRAKNWFLGRPGLILAVVMLILAVILHRLGYIG